MCPSFYTPLRNRADFSRVHTQGRRRYDTLVQLRVIPGENGLRIGIIVSKKYGNAVARNRFKRIVRAAFRNIKEKLIGNWDILVLPRNVNEAKSTELSESFLKLLTELHVIDGKEN
ncbi:MAG: ribonuclease P protein component [bacterium]